MPCLPLCIAAKAAPDTVSVYFPFNKSLLTEAARRRVDAAIYTGTISETKPVQIVGYADKSGGNEYNVRLSKDRAASVKTYLVQSGFSAARITLITGRGGAGAHTASGPEGHAIDRRVDIMIVKVPSQPALPKSPTVARTLKAEPRNLSATDLRTVAPGERLLLDHIYFVGGMAIIRMESCDALDALFNSLRAAPDVRIRIEGHVCCGFLITTAKDDENTMSLSMARARTIYEFLVERGIAASRLEYVGYGYKRPLVMPELNEADYARNRRVEIRIIK